jgi:toxin ParE1/3/4
MTPIIRSTLALRDLDDIWYYIARHNLAAADALMARIEDTCQLLARQPELGQLRPELPTGRYRSFTVGNYVSYYCRTADGIMVARVLHGARDHGPLLEP